MNRIRQLAVSILLCMTATAHGGETGSTVTPSATRAPWTSCASEGQACSFPDTRPVRYGANGTYAELTLAGPVECGNAVFGDPVPGVRKSCSFRNDPPVPDNWTHCANEATAEICIFPGTRLVRYGANGSYVYKTVNGSIRCTNPLFPSDPAVGVDKTCSYASNDFALALAAWAQCAAEDQQCNVTGTNRVRYGAAGTYTYKTVTGPVECSNTVFGDPLPGADKTCSYLANTAPAPGENWTVVDLGSLGGGGTLVADINHAGAIVGSSLLANGSEHAFLYQNGQMSDLGALAGDDSSRAVAINNAGTVLGTSVVAGQPAWTTRVFVSGSGGLSEVAMPAAGNYLPVDINDGGDMMINYQSGTCLGCVLIAHADHSILDLKSKSPAGVSLTNGGTIIAYSGNSFSTTTFYNLNDGTSTPIRTVAGLPTGGVSASPRGWNDHGEVAGYYGYTFPAPVLTESLTLFLYRNGAAADLRTAIAAETTAVSAMNDNGDLVGIQGAREDKQFFLYEAGNGALVSLTDLPAVKNGNWRLDEVKRINNARQIIAHAFDASGQRRAILLTPL